MNGVRTLRRVLVMSLMVTATLAAPAVAQQSASGGSALANPANGGWGCDKIYQPFLDIALGYDGQSYNPFPSNYASCTWYSLIPAESRSGLVPGTGTVTKVRIKSGPNPAPLSITILRRRFQKNPNPPNQITDATCCSATQESQVFQPTPNAISEHEVNLPVQTQESVNGASGWWEIVAVSGRGPGELPISHVGPLTLAAGTQANIATITGYYPHVAKGTDNLGNQTLPNAEVLMQFDWTGAAAAAPPAGTTPVACKSSVKLRQAGCVPKATPLSQIRSSRVTLKRGKVRVSVKCDRTDGKACNGKVRLRTVAKKPVLLASKSMNVAAGKTKTISVSLNGKARKRLKGRKKIRVEVALSGQAAVTRDVTLRR